MPVINWNEFRVFAEGPPSIHSKTIRFIQVEDLRVSKTNLVFFSKIPRLISLIQIRERQLGHSRCLIN